MPILLLKRLALGLLIGGGLGYLYHLVVGCGACPLTATPLRASLYGAVMGLVWALGGSKS